MLLIFMGLSLLTKSKEHSKIKINQFVLCIAANLIGT